MKLFNRKNKLLERLKSLEEELGFFFEADDDYAAHHYRSYGELPKLKDRISLLENQDKKGKK